MNIDFDVDNDILVATIKDVALSAHNAEEFIDRMHHLISIHQPQFLILEMGQLSAIDREGAQSLLNVLYFMRHWHGEIKLVGANETIRKHLKELMINKVVEFYSNTSQAVNSC